MSCDHFTILELDKDSAHQEPEPLNIVRLDVMEDFNNLRICNRVVEYYVSIQLVAWQNNIEAGAQ